nr:MAG TPA: hypothetical protein [Caudoviricetes sp.]
MQKSDEKVALLHSQVMEVTHGSYKGFAQDIECDCNLIEGPHFVKKCAGKKGGRISKRK